MRIFVTGGTGFIGSAVIPELIAAGHQVVALARSDRAAAALTAAGAGVHRGALDDLDSLRRGAAESDGVIHLGYVHDFANLGASGELDRRAVEAMGAALAGSGKPFVGTSVIPVVAPGRLATEEEPPDPAAHATHRIAAENATIALAEHGIRASVIRLPASVHGPGDHAFIPALIAIAREKQVSAYVDDGTNRWPAVHRQDAAHLFRLAVEEAPAGVRLHGVADGGVMLRDIAAVIARHLALPVASVPRAEAGTHFGWLAAFAALDTPASSALTRKHLNWHPEHPNLLADLEAGHYFTE